MTNREDAPSMDESNFESEIVGGAAIVSEVPRDVVSESLDEGIANILPRAVQRSLASWAEDVQGHKTSRPMFQRDKYVTPGQIYKQMAKSYDALDDDVVGNIADTSEAMALQKVAFESEDKDQENIWNQIGRDLDLDEFVRQMWRELFTVSQCYPVRWWGRKEYTVSGKGEKRKRRKSYDLYVPTRLGFLDPTRIVPVKADLWGGSALAWIATEDEMSLLADERNSIQDPLVENLFVGEYKASPQEIATLDREEIPLDQLMLLNPELVWKHTLTKAPFERWSRIRMKSILPILDLKHQLREMDRAFLLGGINFIVLVTRGTDTIPTNRNEVDETTAQVRAQSRSPIIVSDHRINIEIITPDVAHVLDSEKWAVLDERLLMRGWGTFALPSEQGNKETSLTTGRVIARGLASRRHMMKRNLEKEIIRAVQEDPRNGDADFDEHTTLEFAPRRMELEFDAAVVTMIQSLRDRGDLSRETTLTEFNFDQEIEAARRQHEDEKWGDKVFKPTNVPFDSPNKGNPDQTGRKGGKPAGQPEKKEEE